ncbi:hypothetical protein PIB30_056325 [Stylosanthes scabra]|uniref:Uncharacterized protein n=1 Tax=Stylosanthes scabra TaxID=79078 RepID=A0ABU6TJ48_9FABA|nr:hypothetical protein [Stylosanthes scabra]
MRRELADLVCLLGIFSDVPEGTINCVRFNLIRSFAFCELCPMCDVNMEPASGPEPRKALKQCHTPCLVTRGHANLLCIVPILSDVPEGTRLSVRFNLISSYIFYLHPMRDLNMEPITEPRQAVPYRKKKALFEI